MQTVMPLFMVVLGIVVALVLIGYIGSMLYKLWKEFTDPEMRRIRAEVEIFQTMILDKFSSVMIDTPVKVIGSGDVIELRLRADSDFQTSDVLSLRQELPLLLQRQVVVNQVSVEPVKDILQYFVIWIYRPGSQLRPVLFGAGESQS